jgi:two-component system, OmpR family, heavy metal sensor histidine kinase CusS
LSHARASSLAARLVLLFALGSALIFMATGYALYHALKMRVDANEAAELGGKSAAVERLLGEVHTLAELTAHIDRFRDVSVGHPHLSVGVTGNGRSLLPLPAEVGNASGRTWLTHRLSRELRDGVAVEAVLAIETTETRTLLRDHAIIAALMALAGTVASALLALGVVRRGLAPLALLAGRAEQVTAERLGARLSLQDAPREVHGLADSINRMLERLEESFRALEQFSADIAHELRTPLNNLLLQTQVTLSRPRGEADYREALHSNLEELERVQRMVLDMLFLARADRGMIAPAREEIDLRSEIESVSDYFEAAAAERSQTIAVRGGARIVADRSLLRRAMNNLLSNAVRYSAPGSAIDIAIEQSGIECSVTVSNPAEAIPEDELRRLFKRFARRDDSRGRTVEGAGLGLAIVESIMKLQGGTLRARQEGGLLRFILGFSAQIAIS